MSAVPPNLSASVLQSNLVQRQAAGVRDAERNQRAGAERQQARAVDQADSTVETADDMTEVFTDAEGSGSQGRAFDTPEETTSTEMTQDEGDGEGHILDLEA
jgi:hypothetical protein